jgi:hypothetical protein
MSTPTLSPHERHTPTQSELLCGAAPAATIDSGSSSEMLRAVLRNGAGALALNQQLLCFEVETTSPDTGSPQRVRVLAQARRTEQTNSHHESPLLRAYVREHGSLPGLSGRADHRVIDLYPVDAVVIPGRSGADVIKAPPSAVVPPTGTDVYVADNDTIQTFIDRRTPGLLNVGHLVATTHLPLSLPHHGDGPDGVSEGRHYGMFGISGSGKTVLLSQLICGWARHRMMGQLIVDHDGDLSALRVGRSADGAVHFDLAAGLAAAGRALGSDVRRVPIRDVAIEAPGDLAATLRHEGFLADLGVGRGATIAEAQTKLKLELAELTRTTSFRDLDYDTAIGPVCQAVAEAYAVGKVDAQGSSARDKRAQQLLDTATAGTATARRLRLTWEKVQGYNSRRWSLVALAEAALLDGQVVILNMAGSASRFDDMVLARTVRTVLDVARCVYQLGEGLDSEAYHRFGYLKDRFGRYKGAQVNAICVIDEASVVAGEEAAREEGSVAADLRDAIRRTRKLRLGFCLATQEVGSVAKAILLGVHTKIFGYGLRLQSEQDRVREVLAEPSAFRQYQQLSDPKSGGRYPFAIQGAALPFANGGPVFMHAYRTAEQFFEANGLEPPSPGTSSNGSSPTPPSSGSDLPPLRGLDGLDE